MSEQRIWEDFSHRTYRMGEKVSIGGIVWQVVRRLQVTSRPRRYLLEKVT
jgi:hypothetical protein